MNQDKDNRDADKPLQTAPKTVCIIGGGLTGLTAAYYLGRSGYRVIVLESSLTLGGMVASLHWGHQPVEYIYHHLFTSDHAFISLCKDLGIEQLISWHQTKDAIVSEQTCYPFSGPVDLIRYTALPLVARIRTGLTVLKAGRLKDWQPLESITAESWLIRQAGPTAWLKLWQPLLQSKFDTDAEDISAVWIWNKFKLRGHSRKSKVSSSSLGYMQGGFIQLIQALEAEIIKMDGQILKGRTAVSLRKRQYELAAELSTRHSTSDHASHQSEADWKNYCVSAIHDDGSISEYHADAIITTVSGRQFANMAAPLNLPDNYMRQAQALRYKADLCLILHLDVSLSPYYWTTICDAMPFVVVVEHTHLTGTEPYQGHIVYISRYLDVTDPLWSKSDGQVFSIFIRALKKLYPHLNHEHINKWRLRRTRFAQPVVDRHYSKKMPALDTPDPGVKLAGMAQIYPEDRGMNYAVRLANQAVSAVQLYLKHESDAEKEKKKKGTD